MPRKSHASPLSEAMLLELVGDVVGLLEIEELRRGMLAALGRVLPSEYISLNEVGPAGVIATVMHPDESLLLYDRWEELAHENPLLRRYLRTLDGQAYRFSDVIERKALHELELYKQLYAPLGVEYQVAFNLPANPEHVLAIALSRGAQDYSDAEREFINRARPFLIQAYLNALAYESARIPRAEGFMPALAGRLVARGLTVREAEVLAMIALGRSNQHIASALGISYRTVGKHLERGYRKLDVGDRSSAAARVWQLLEAAGD
jgi:DNA-binding CsgD family transcriptional regulator